MSCFLKVLPVKAEGGQHLHIPTSYYRSGVWINIDNVESVSSAGTYVYRTTEEGKIYHPQSRIIFRSDRHASSTSGARGYTVDGAASDIMKRIAEANVPCVEMPEPEPEPAPKPKKTTTKKTAASGTAAS